MILLPKVLLARTEETFMVHGWLDLWVVFKVCGDKIDFNCLTSPDDDKS